MTAQTCRHGFTLSQACRECDLAKAQEIDRRFGPDVDEARRVIAEAKEQTIEEQR